MTGHIIIVSCTFSRAEPPNQRPNELEELRRRDREREPRDPSRLAPTPEILATVTALKGFYITGRICHLANRNHYWRHLLRDAAEQDALERVSDLTTVDDLREMIANNV
jgi:hypothetical protein